MENYFASQRHNIFRNVAVLIYVFDVESRELEKDFHYYSSCLQVRPLCLGFARGSVPCCTFTSFSWAAATAARVSNATGTGIGHTHARPPLPLPLCDSDLMYCCSRSRRTRPTPRSSACCIRWTSSRRTSARWCARLSSWAGGVPSRT